MPVLNMRPCSLTENISKCRLAYHTQELILSGEKLAYQTSALELLLVCYFCHYAYGTCTWTLPPPPPPPHSARTGGYHHTRRCDRRAHRGRDRWWDRPLCGCPSPHCSGPSPAAIPPAEYIWPLLHLRSNKTEAAEVATPEPFHACAAFKGTATPSLPTFQCLLPVFLI